MPSSIFTIEEKLAEYRTITSDLSNLQWRTVTLLLGSTFLMLFWLTSAIELLFKIGPMGYFPLRAAGAFPPMLNGLSWLLWMAPEYLGLFRSAPFRRESSREEDGGSLLEQLEYARYRFWRTSRT